LAAARVLSTLCFGTVTTPALGPSISPHTTAPSASFWLATIARHGVGACTGTTTTRTAWEMPARWVNGRHSSSSPAASCPASISSMRAAARHCGAFRLRDRRPRLPEHQFTISGMLGLGDNIYQRAFMKRYSEPVGLITPWPEIYEDLPNVRCIKPNTTLRTQLKNVRRQGEWSTQRGMIRRVHYGRNGIMPGLTAAFGFEPAAMDLPSYGEPLVSGDYVLVRPVTVRAEWR